MVEPRDRSILILAVGNLLKLEIGIVCAGSENLRLNSTVTPSNTTINAWESYANDVL
jgi:hypothetical protein